MVSSQTLTQKDPPKGQHLTVNLVTGTPDTDSIKIPKTGTFKVIFTGGGGRLTITDNDATDGEARVSIPSGRFDGYLQNRGEPNNKITYEDKLYYIKQEISRDKGQPVWWRIGKRELPIPTDWHSDDGASYVLTITNAGVTNISTRWYPTTEESDIPPGIKEIGTEGGLVDLPGIGSLNIPAGALNQTTTIVMKQILEGSRPEGFLYVSPVVKIEPSGTVFNTPAIIKLNIIQELVGNNHPALNQYISMNKLPELKHEDFSVEQELEFLEEMVPPEQATYDRGAYIKHLSVVARTQDKSCEPEDAKSLDKMEISSNGNFLIFYTLKNGSAYQTDEKYILKKYSNSFANVLGKGFDYYSSLQPGKIPKPWYYCEKIGGKYIPVFVRHYKWEETTSGYAEAKNLSPSKIPPDCQIYLQPKLDDTIERLDMAYHEVYHLFQYHYIDFNKIEELKSSEAVYQFPYESSARYMGTSRVYADWQVNLEDIWLHGYYGSDLVKNIIILPNSLYDTPDKYKQCGLMGYLANAYGDSFLIYKNIWRRLFE